MELKEIVKEKYGQAAQRVHAGGSSCCGAPAVLYGCCDPITSNLYDPTQTGEVPQEAVLASLGCGNPTALVLPSLREEAEAIILPHTPRESRDVG